MIQRSIKYILSTCFLLSSLLKAFSIKAFEQEVQLYGDVYIGTWVHSYSLEIAIIVCVVEGGVALVSLWNRMAFACSLIYLAMLLFFVYLTGTNLFMPSLLGSIESCGCFGELIHFTPTTSFLKSLLLFILSIANVYYLVRTTKECTISNI